MRLLRLFLLLMLIAVASPVMADELRPGYLELSQQSERFWQVKLKAPVKGGLAANASLMMPPYCALGAPRRTLIDGSLTSVWRADCAQTIIGAEVGIVGLDKTLTDALLRVAPLGRPVQAMRLTAVTPTAVIASLPSRWQVASTYFVTGVEHILLGYDHLLFVVSLVLLLGGLWTIAKAVTAFTVAHSITLIGTTLRVLGLPQAPVESVIALSILFLAVEILKKNPDVPRLSERLPWVVAFVFGLLHGFGFAGALKEIGLPEGDVPTALLTFNLGVEAGQLMIVLVTLAALKALARFARPLMRPTLTAATYAVGITASFWFIERTFA
jgi:hydrogenase/urease accessory protein HupE